MNLVSMVIKSEAYINVQYVDMYFLSACVFLVSRGLMVVPVVEMFMYNQVYFL